MYLQSSSSSSSNELHGTTDSSLRSMTLSHNAPGIYDMSDLLCFLSVIAIFDATLFCDDFNSSRFSYSNVIIILINCL